MPPWPRMLPRRAWRCLTLGLLLALAAACGPAGAPASPPRPQIWTAPDPAPAMPAPTPTPALLRPTPTPIVQDYPDITWQVAPSLEEQVFTSPVVVRASLQAAAAAVETVPSTPGVAPTYRPVQELRFTVHEYLKGTGPAALVVVVRGTHAFLTEAEARADAVYAVAQRVTAWDDRQGVLFLQTPAQPYASATAGGGAAGAAGSSSAPALQFTRSNFHREQEWDYSVDTLSRAWLPARDAGGAAGQDAGGGRRRHGVHHRRGGVAAAGGVLDGPAGPDRGAGCRAAGWGRHRGLRRTVSAAGSDMHGIAAPSRGPQFRQRRWPRGRRPGPRYTSRETSIESHSTAAGGSAARTPSASSPGSSTTTINPATATTTRWPPPAPCPPAPIACTTTGSTIRKFRATLCPTTLTD